MAAAQYKQFFGTDRLPDRQAEHEAKFCRGGPPPRVGGAVSAQWHETVKAPPTPIHPRGTSWSGPGQAKAFWATSPSFNNPAREHRGCRSVMIEQRVANGAQFAGSKRCLTPQGGLPSVTCRDSKAKLKRGLIQERLQPIVVPTDLRGHSHPKQVFLDNGVAGHGNRRRTGFTNGLLKFGKHYSETPTAKAAMGHMVPEIQITDSQKRMEDEPLYSSFGLPTRNRIKQFDPSFGMPPRWKQRLQARVDLLRPSSREMCKRRMEATVSTEGSSKLMASTGTQDEFSPGADWLTPGPLEQKGATKARGSTKRRGSNASVISTCNAVTFADLPVVIRGLS